MFNDMRPLKLVAVLSVLLLAALMTQCSRPATYSGDPAADQKQPVQAPSSTPAASGPAGIPPGISPTGGRGNDPTTNPTNPQTNPQNNLDGTQSPVPDPRNPTRQQNGK